MIDGTFEITMVLPPWTVVNDLVMQGNPDGTITGTLDMRSSPNGKTVFPIERGFWNKNFFHIFVDVELGKFECIGTVTESGLTGYVEIENKPDLLFGLRKK